MTVRTRRRSMLTTLGLTAAFAMLAMTIGVQQAVAAPTRTCALAAVDRDPPGSKPTYNLLLKSRGAACPVAKKVMRAFHTCRSQKAFVCKKKVLGSWTCSGRKRSSTAVIMYAQFTCRSGARRVIGDYQQNT